MNPSRTDRLPPATVGDPVIDAYRPGVDTTLLIENLRLTPAQRLDQLESLVAGLEELRRAGAIARKRAQ